MSKTILEQAAELIPVPPEHWKSAAAERLYSDDGAVYGFTISVVWEVRISVPETDMDDVGDGLATTYIGPVQDWDWHTVWRHADEINAFIRASRAITEGKR